MDKSKENILMCEKAVGIQKLWKWKLNPIGDLCWLGSDYLDCAVGVITKPFLQREGRVWLPRQDQLQEMLNLKLAHLLSQFGEFIKDPENYGAYPFTSMEQLWLAFVMWKLYLKIWDGKEWRKK